MLGGGGGDSAVFSLLRKFPDFKEISTFQRKFSGQRKVQENLRKFEVCRIYIKNQRKLQLASCDFYSLTRQHKPFRLISMKLSLLLTRIRLSVTSEVAITNKYISMVN